MTVQDNYKLESYITNGSITSFDFSFKVLEKSNIIVNVEDTEGNITQKQQQTDYEIVLNTDFTGTVVFKEAPIKDYKIYIQRIVDLDQEARYETSSGFQAEVIEKSFDKLTMINQQQRAEIDTCLKINQFKDIKISNYAETPIENKGIMWAKNEDGSFYLKNTQENPDIVYNKIVKNENVVAIGSNLITDNTIGTCAKNINNINTTAKNINDINLCGNDIDNINIVASNISEIKDKADRDLSNISNTGKEIITNFGMPSNKYIDLSVTSGQNNYGTAPANGYIVLQVANCSHYRVWNKTVNSAFGIWNYQGNNMNYGSGFVPIAKGQEWGIYTQDGTITVARFYYLAGSSNN